ncbi:MAG: glycosyltransferase family protein [Candidatus Omnitrophota bacterium]
MRIGIIVQARLSSSRLPGKVLYELGGQPVLGLICQRLKRSRQSQEIIVATGDGHLNYPIMEVAKRYGVLGFAGPEEDVLQRYALAAQHYGLDGIVRVTADCPLVDPELIDEMIAVFLSKSCDYVTNVKPPSWPDGLDISIFTRALLERANQKAEMFSERQHVVTWMWKAVFNATEKEFRGVNFVAPEDLSRHRWVIDEPRDYSFFQELVKYFGPDKLCGAGWRDVISVLQFHPDLCKLNGGIIRDEGLARDLLKDGVWGKIQNH